MCGTSTGLRRPVAPHKEGQAMRNRISGKPPTAKQQKAFMRFAVDNCPEVVFWMGKEGDFIYVNKVACSRLGYSEDELLGMSVMDIDPWYNITEWPHHFEELRQAGSMVFESRHRRKDGATFPVEVNVSYLDLDGNEFLGAVVRDISDLMTAGEANREIGNRFDAVFRAFEDPVFVLDDSGIILDANPATRDALGFGKDELVGKGINEFLTPASREHFLEVFNNVLKDESARCRMDFVRKDQSVRSFECRPEVITDDEGVITSVMLFQKVAAS